MSKRNDGNSGKLPPEDSDEARKRLHDAGFDSFDDWYVATRTCIKKVARVRHVPESDIDDFLQTGMIAAWAWLMFKFTPTPGDRPTSRRKYLAGVIKIAYRIPMNRGLETIPSEIEPEIEDNRESATPIRNIEDSAEVRARVRRCIQQLPMTQQREMMQLYIESGMNIAELHRALGIKYHRAYSLFRNAIEQLRQCLDDGESGGKSPP